VNTRRGFVIGAAGFVGWMLCFVTMGVGMAVLSLDSALAVHAVAAPVIFAAVSAVYFARFGYTSPLATASVFVGFVISMDFVVVAVLINRSLAMFASPIGTWIPFASIFASTYLTGAYLGRRRLPAGPAASLTATRVG
jgi:hypothetical protein